VFAKVLKLEQVSFEDTFVCYTCEKTFHISEAQAGHCFHRGRQRYKALDFDDKKHIRLQHGGCNMDMHGGNQNIFQLKLTVEQGTEAIKQLIWRRHNEPALTVEELLQIEEGLLRRKEIALLKWQKGQTNSIQ